MRLGASLGRGEDDEEMQASHHRRKLPLLYSILHFMQLVEYVVRIGKLLIFLHRSFRALKTENRFNVVALWCYLVLVLCVVERATCPFSVSNP